MEVDDLLPIVEATNLLAFTRTDQGDVELTPAGRSFAGADIETRKVLFRDAVLAHTPLLKQMNGALQCKSDGEMPVEFFRDILDEHFSVSETQRQIETALNWGRYGEIFTYDSEGDRLLLHGGSANSAGDVVQHE